MKLRPNLVSIVIPSYNQPEYLRRAIQSVVEQTYRPLEVIVADDASPTNLEPVVASFRPLENDALRLRYFRHAANQGMVENFHSGVRRAQGQYLLPLPHDNRFLLKNFLAAAVRRLQEIDGALLCYANAVYEDSGRPALRFPDSIRFADDWAVLDGDRFIRLYGNRGIGWSQVILMDHAAAVRQGAFQEPFAVTGPIARRLGIAQDDAFSYVFLLSAVGKVCLYRGLACEIGAPMNSYSRADAHWRATRRRTTFVNFYNLARADLEGPYARAVRKQAKRLAHLYADSILDPRIAAYYCWKPGILGMMILGFFKHLARQVRYGVKRSVNVIRPGTFRKVTPE